MDNDRLDQVVMEVLRFHQEVRDGELNRILIREFPEDAELLKLWGPAWDYPPVEKSLMRLLGRGLVTARENSSKRLVDWKVVDPLEALAKL
jgi:hypothetical protein